MLLTSGRIVLGQTYQLDNSHTAVIFSVAHLRYSFTYGRFNKVQGDFTLSKENPAASQFRFVIDTNSIDSNDAKRDEHLKGPDFFNANQFPTIAFQSTAVTPGQDGMLNVTGDLTMHGVTKKITLPMKQLGSGPGPMGKQRTGFFLKTEIKRSDFGMTNMLAMVGDEISITISFEGIQQ